MDIGKQQCICSAYRHIIPLGYDIKCTTICALNGSLCQMEVSAREARKDCIRIQHRCEQQLTTAWNHGTSEMDLLSPPARDIL